MGGQTSKDDNNNEHFDDRFACEVNNDDEFDDIDLHDSSNKFDQPE